MCNFYSGRKSGVHMHLPPVPMETGSPTSPLARLVHEEICSPLILLVLMFRPESRAPKRARVPPRVIGDCSSGGAWVHWDLQELVVHIVTQLVCRGEFYSTSSATK